MPMNTVELIEERITFDNSDDERDVDVDGEVDSDDDAYSSDCRSSKNSSSNLNTVDKRAHHNALERKRRDHIKDSFLTLRESVPHLSSEKASRAQILKKAAEFIQLMRVKNNSHQNDIHELKRQNNLLESQIRHLERQKLSMVNKCNSDSDEEIEPVSKRKKKPTTLH